MVEETLCSNQAGGDPTLPVYFYLDCESGCQSFLGNRASNNTRPFVARSMVDSLDPDTTD